ncbi:LLM class flavin-dependent oxidoreductase [Cellulomonas sp. ICMP 17802]|uniref:LLM class flavin-dependent oxidoreductase n=1 Tax=Cellulomonas sp. ICMP 17802 TaxID=3239199 RepID=UPI00351BC2B3
MSRHAHLGIDLSDTGAHAAAWRDHGSRGQRLFDAARLLELVTVAQRGALDFVVFDDDFALHPSRSTTLQGRLDAALVAARLAPRTTGIGLVSTVGTTHTAAAHVAKAVATIDHASHGRAGWQVGWDTRIDDVPTAGPRSSAVQSAAVAAAAEAAGVVGRHWDRWDESAEAPSARRRFVAHDGVHFAAAPPTAAPRPPQGRPPVVVRADSPAATELAGRHADVVRVRVTGPDEAAQARARVRAAVAAAGRDPRDVRVLVDTHLVVGPDRASAQARHEMLAELEGVDAGTLSFVGTTAGFAELVSTWVDDEIADGFVVRPSSVHTDLPALVDGVVPLLRAADRFRLGYPGATLRDTLGLPLAAARYAATA